MGLDMYLKGTLYIGEQWEHQGVKKEVSITMKRGENTEQISLPTTEEAPLSEMVFSLGYWRKANAIHNWFVQNVQEGEDDCGTYQVSMEEMETLLNLCKTILAEYEVTKDFSLCESVKELQTKSGFFFGNTEYDEGYLYDLKDTVYILEKSIIIAKRYENSSADFYVEYHSSW